MVAGRGIRIALWLIVAGVLVTACAALWIAGELHYRNCLTETGAVQKIVAPWRPGPSGGASKCSRWPF